VVSPQVAQIIDLARDTTGRFFGAGPFGMGPNTLWGIPRVTSFALSGNQVIAGDFRYAIWYDRERDTIRSSDSHADFFTSNKVAVLAETRGLAAVLYPGAFRRLTVTNPNEPGGGGPSGDDECGNCSHPRDEHNGSAGAEGPAGHCTHFECPGGDNPSGTAPCPAFIEPGTRRAQARRRRG
jgi:hypothetical protein